MADKTPWHTYIVECRDNTLYTGITNNLPDRVKAHNNGKGAKYTRQRLPVALVYSEKFDCRSAAAKREYQLKQLTKKEKLKLIKENRDEFVKSPNLNCSP